MATLDFTTLVMQDGVMSSLFGVENTGPLLAFLPVITIGLLFGLAIDYELFLMTRVHEEYSKTGDNDHSIRVGIKESGPVIVAAALIMFSVFLAFIFQDDTAVKSMGLSLAFGVLFDAFIVRMTLIPALTKLFGNASWYLPKWLSALLPKIDVEGKALEDHHQSSTSNKTQSEAPRYREFADVDNHHKQSQSTVDNKRHLDRNTSYYDDNVDYETLYTEEGTPKEYENHQHHEYYERPSHFDKTTHLYKDLTDDNMDQDVLFKALMLYAREHNRHVFDKYQTNHVEHQNDDKEGGERY